SPGGTNGPQYLQWNIPEEYHYDTFIAERSIAMLEEYHAADQPFFLWSSFLDPHPPYLVPTPWDTMYDPATLTIPEGRDGEHDKNPKHIQLTQQEHPDFSEYQEPEGHSLHGLSEQWRGRDKLPERIAVYYGMISLMDKYIGKILDKLEELGLEEDTVVCFSTDHGHFYGHHNL